MPTPQELVRSIEQRVLFRTHGRVHRLIVELCDQLVVLHGNTKTYYAKQLAQHAALELLGNRALVNAIEVGR